MRTRTKLLMALGLVPALVLALTVSAWATGTGFFLGYSGGAYVFSLGHDDGNRLVWDGSNLTLVSEHLTIDNTGIRITPDATAEVSRMYGFSGALIGMAHPTDVLALYTDDDIQFLKYSAGIVWGWTVADKAIYPAGSDYSFGTSANPAADMYGGIYHAKISGSTYDGGSFGCGGSGEFVESIITKGGIVTDVNCATPGPAPASEVAALRSEVANLKALVNQLLAGATK